MNTRIGLIVMLAVLTCSVSKCLGAETVVVTSANYTAACGGQPPKANPEGTWEKPADGVDWRVVWDYEQKADARAKWLPMVGIGGSKLLAGAATSGTWGPIGAENLPNPLPAECRVRAMLQRKENGEWVTKKTGYKTFP